MAVYKINESAEEVKEESTKVEEAVTNDYRVVGVSMDVAVPANKSLDDYGTDGSTSGKLYQALRGALKSVGLEMAGDYVDAQADHTEVYKDNDYTFEFEESLKEDITETPIEDIDKFTAEVKERFPGSEVIFDGDTNTIKITLDNKKEEEESLKEAFSGTSVMTIKLQRGIKADGFIISIKDTEGNEVFKQEYSYGVNASYDERMANAQAPYTTDILRDLVSTYNVNRIEVTKGKNIFKGTDVDDKYVTNFKKDYLSEFEGLFGESVEETPEELTSDIKEETLTPEYTSDLLDMAQVSFETGVRFDEGDFEDSEDFGKYQQLMDLGPAGFYEEYKDTLDFDPDFVAEYGVEEESLKESDSTVRNFTIEDVDGDVVDYKANSAKEASERYKKDHPGSEILSVYDEDDTYYDIETGDELEG